MGQPDRLYFGVSSLSMFIFLLFFTVLTSLPAHGNEDTARKENRAVEISLKKTAIKQNLYKLNLNQKPEPSVFSKYVSTIKHRISTFGNQTVFIWSGAGQFPAQARTAVDKLVGGKGSLLRTLTGLFFLIAISALVEVLFYRSIRLIKGEKALPTCIGNLFRKLFNQLVFDLTAVVVFSITLLGLMVVFIPAKSPLYEVTLAYLPSVLMIRLTYVILNFIYSPMSPQTRIVPQNCPSTMLYMGGILSFVLITTLSKHTLLLLMDHGMSTHAFLFGFSVTGLIQFAILFIVFFQDRSRISRLISQYRLKTDPHLLVGKELSPGTDTGKTKFWLFFIAVAGLVCFEILWQANLLLSQKDLTLPLLLTILSIPAGIMLFSIGNRLLLIASGRKDLMDPRIINKDILPNDMDLSEKLKIELPDDPGMTNEADWKNSIILQHMTWIKNIMGTLIGLLVFFWVIDLWGLRISMGLTIVRSALTVLVTLLISYILWEVSRAFIDGKIKEEIPETVDAGDGEGGKGGSRKGTILTLLKKFILSSIAVIVTMVVLNALGIDIKPLLAGAGIIGIAIGFGSQALVKDILSGLFFLIDDAFRVGDYIETGAIKGMVQQISLRSIKLRHPRGMVFTIPYGDMGSVKNYSRDYIISKLEIRVKYDANIDKIRKIVKRINKAMENHEEFGPVLLSKIKSQGVLKMDDSAMIVRVKFKTIPGEQFVIRREVYKKIQEGFKEHGIEFAHKNVTVYLPPQNGDEQTTASDQKKLLEAGAAAAAAHTALPPEK